MVVLGLEVNSDFSYVCISSYTKIYESKWSAY